MDYEYNKSELKKFHAATRLHIVAELLNCEAGFGEWGENGGMDIAMLLLQSDEYKKAVQTVVFNFVTDIRHIKKLQKRITP